MAIGGGDEILSSVFSRNIWGPYIAVSKEFDRVSQAYIASQDTCFFVHRERTLSLGFVFFGERRARTEGNKTGVILRFPRNAHMTAETNDTSILSYCDHLCTKLLEEY